MKKIISLGFACIFTMPGFLSQTANATVLCVKGTAIKARPATCVGKETLLPIGAIGPAGPQGPQGPAGPTGPQGPAGQGISNSPCAQSDIGGAWSFTYNADSEFGICLITLNSAGSFISGGSSCSVGGKPTATITSGSISLSQASGCFYSVSYNRNDGKSWTGFITVDRTRSNFAGMVGSNSTGISLVSGVKLGALSGINSANSLQNDASSPLDLDDPGSDSPVDKYQEALDSLLR